MPIQPLAAIHSKPYYIINPRQTKLSGDWSLMRRKNDRQKTDAEGVILLVRTSYVRRATD